jgi:hypothetical protein
MKLFQTIVKPDIKLARQFAERYGITRKDGGKKKNTIVKDKKGESVSWSDPLLTGVLTTLPAPVQQSIKLKRASAAALPKSWVGPTSRDKYFTAMRRIDSLEKKMTNAKTKKSIDEIKNKIQTIQINFMKRFDLKNDPSQDFLDVTLR